MSDTYWIQPSARYEEDTNSKRQICYSPERNPEQYWAFMINIIDCQFSQQEECIRSMLDIQCNQTSSTVQWKEPIHNELLLHHKIITELIVYTTFEC